MTPLRPCVFFSFFAVKDFKLQRTKRIRKDVKASSYLIKLKDRTIATAGAYLLVAYTLGRIIQGNQLAERILFLGKWSCWVSTDDGHNFAAVNTFKDEVALIHCDHPIPLSEDRIVVHMSYMMHVFILQIHTKVSKVQYLQGSTVYGCIR